jgi:hypothetical protein
MLSLDYTRCKKCGGELAPGKAIENTYTGLPDFPGDKHPVTMSPGGKGTLIDCMKCEKCGWSIYSGESLEAVTVRLMLVATNKPPHKSEIARLSVVMRDSEAFKFNCKLVELALKERKI